MIQSISSNMQAFLDVIAISEGTSTSVSTRFNGYDVIVTGIDGKPEVFTDFHTHPFANGRAAKVINKAGLTSSASGRYQVLYRFYEAYKKILNLPDFSPESQDKIAIQLIKECRAIPLIEAGHIKEAIQACSSRWASFPGAGYGQHTNSIDYLVNAFVKAGGTVAGGVVCVT